MGIFDDLANILKTRSKNRDVVKLQQKADGLRRELLNLFLKIGEFTYNNRQNSKTLDSSELMELFERVDIIKTRMLRFENTVSGLKSSIEDMKGRPDSSLEKISDIPGFSNLSISNRDLNIRRTKDGIAFFRICRVCGKENARNIEYCEGCGGKMQ